MRFNDRNKTQFEHLTKWGVRDHLALGIHFIQRFIINPAQIGSVCPSSRALASEMLSRVNFADPNLNIVEVGPGTGPITKVVFEKMSERHRFHAFELDPILCAQLEKKYGARFFINDSCEKITNYLSTRTQDAIVSSLPWTNFSHEMQKSILDPLYQSLKDGGVFSTFVYAPGYYIPSAVDFRKLLEAEFSKVSISPIVWRNFPPAIVYHCVK